ncbi:MAG TPA: hypothetical protein VNK96_03895 [Fimbriimonadales bacterium]|nr:hypothetical protein [Fimbriimonadales bacterium]
MKNFSVFVSFNLVLIAGVFSTAIASRGSDAYFSGVYFIEGAGFFPLEKNGEIVYVKEGNFGCKGLAVVHESGLRLYPPIKVPTGASAISIAANGDVMAHVGNQERKIGKILLAVFPDTCVMIEEGGIWKSNAKPKYEIPGVNGCGKILKRNTQVRNNKTISIRVKSLSEISGKTISLGEVALVEGHKSLVDKINAVSLGASPDIGNERLITRITIQNALQSAKIPLESVEIIVPSRAIVRRCARMVSGEEIEQFAREWIQANFPTLQNLELVQKPSARKVADGDLRFRVSYHKETERSLVLSVEASLDGEKQFVQQLVFNKPNQKPDIKPGAIVNIVLQSNGITVETTGKVKSVSENGQVTVTIEPTKAIVTGTLRPDGVVEVKL